MAESTMDKALAETEKTVNEQETLHSSLSPYDLGPDVEDYEYKKLGVPSPKDNDYRDKKRFRLLNLMSGFLDNPTVYCQIFEVEVNIATDCVSIVPDPESTANAPTSSRVSQIQDTEYVRPVSQDASPNESIAYEALSWRWGDEKNANHAIMIKTNQGERKKRVSYTLGLALKNLRHQTQTRMIWIDALCINQDNFDERSSQVAMMDRLYTGASQVCVWLGKEDEETRTAIKFIKEEINELRDFDKLCKEPKHASQWRALLGLMQRDWFSRRWVVQELALARRATVYCGPDSIAWTELAIAIELFVEVEEATHRLSELMKKVDRTNVIPNWFEHISELGASLLVTETSKIFRDYKEKSDKRPLGLVHLLDKGPGRRSLLSLEYLVTSLSIFDCGRPHDFVYALVAISRDAFPSPPTSITQRSKEALVTEVMSSFVERKPFPLDYEVPYPDVARDFIEFTIQRRWDSGKDEERALDILCRPWSKDWQAEDDEDAQPNENKLKEEKPRLFENSVHDWMILSETQHEEYKFKHAPLDCRLERDERTMKQWREQKGREKAKREMDLTISEEDYWKKWYPWFRTEKPHDKTEASEQPSGTTATYAGKATKPKHPKSSGVHLPSWVANVTKAPFDIFRHPGVEMTKMGRKNADPLVGSLDSRAGTYSAAQSKKQNRKEVKFKKRTSLGHYSLYVKGFHFDRVEIVDQVSQQGAIPASWLGLGGWDRALRPKHQEAGPTEPGGDPDDGPPDALWRTLVADRGLHNQNPPYYYSRACRETIMKGALLSNAVDTTALIHNERNSIIAEFCRRTQCVIWNRAMIKTQNGSLGLVSPDVKKGDLVCIIYGCTVPVILREAETRKTARDRKDEMKDDCFESLKRCFKKCLQRRARKLEYKKRKADTKSHEQEIQDHLSLLKAKVLAQSMMDIGIEKLKYEMDVWRKPCKDDGAESQVEHEGPRSVLLGDRQAEGEGETTEAEAEGQEPMTTTEYPKTDGQEPMATKDPKVEGQEPKIPGKYPEAYEQEPMAMDGPEGKGKNPITTKDTEAEGQDPITTAKDPAAEGQDPTSTTEDPAAGKPESIAMEAVCTGDEEHQKMRTKLEKWLEGHPWQKYLDDLLKEVKITSIVTKSALLAWLQKLDLEDVAVKQWLKSKPAVWGQDAVNKWVDGNPWKTEDVKPEGWSEILDMWNWLHSESKPKGLDLGKESREAWRNWRKKKPYGSISKTAENHHNATKEIMKQGEKYVREREDADQVENETKERQHVEGVEKETKEREDVNQVEKDIKEWENVKSRLDRIVHDQEQRMADQQAAEFENELRVWQKTREKLERDRNRKQAASQGNKKAWNVNRWSQMTPSLPVDLKLNKEGCPGTGHLWSDEESDEHSEGDGQDWEIEGQDYKEQESDSDSGNERTQGAEGDGKQANSSGHFGKKERQRLADLRDPSRHYKFLGEAYIHGMMEGEAVSQSFYKKKPEHLFEIR